jgi:heat shock protein HslJ
LRPAVAALAALVVLAACGGPSVTPEPARPAAAADVEGPWQLVAGIVGGHQLTLVEDARVTLIVDEDGAGGQAACNSYGGAFSIADGRVTVGGSLSRTEIACADPVVALEKAYLSALSVVDAAHMNGATLVLTGGPNVELHFERLQPPPVDAITEVPWLLESRVDGDRVTPAVGDPATLLLRADGSLAGSTGCRRLSGRYHVYGDEVSANEFHLDDRKCPAGPLRAQDNHVVGVLADGFRASVDGPLLMLGREDGIGLIYRRME